MQDEDVVQWEDRIFDDRKYKGSQRKVVLEMGFNDPEIKEVIEQDIEAKPVSPGAKLKGSLIA